MNVSIHKGPLSPTLDHPGCSYCLSGRGAPICGGCRLPFTMSTALHETIFCSMTCERTAPEHMFTRRHRGGNRG